MKKILMVDDQAESIQLVTYFLKDKYDVYSAKTVVQAFSLLRSLSMQEFDLILLDILMPRVNGIELFQYIQKEYLHAIPPVIFISSEADIEIVSHALNLGATGYIKKPFDAKTLIQKIESVIGV